MIHDGTRRRPHEIDLFRGAPRILKQAATCSPSSTLVIRYTTPYHDMKASASLPCQASSFVRLFLLFIHSP